MIASTGAVALLPAYAGLPSRFCHQRSIQGNAPTVDLVVAYNEANTSHILKLFLSRVDDLATRGAGMHSRSTS
jgi:LysR family transcriptional regulator, hca operon transcriptional activator